MILEVLIFECCVYICYQVGGLVLENDNSLVQKMFSSIAYCTKFGSYLEHSTHKKTPLIHQNRHNE